MKKTLIILSMGALLAACNKKTEQKTEAKDTVAVDNTTAVEKSPGGTAQFDINSIPVSNAEVGELPFSAFPKDWNLRTNRYKEVMTCCFFHLTA